MKPERAPRKRYVAPDSVLRRVRLCEDVPVRSRGKKTGAQKLWAFSYLVLSELFGMPREGLRELVKQGYLQPRIMANVVGVLATDPERLAAVLQIAEAAGAPVRPLPKKSTPATQAAEVPRCGHGQVVCLEHSPLEMLLAARALLYTGPLGKSASLDHYRSGPEDEVHVARIEMVRHSGEPLCIEGTALTRIAAVFALVLRVEELVRSEAQNTAAASMTKPARKRQAKKAVFH